MVVVTRRSTASPAHQAKASPGTDGQRGGAGFLGRKRHRWPLVGLVRCMVIAVAVLLLAPVATATPGAWIGGPAPTHTPYSVQFWAIVQDSYHGLPAEEAREPITEHVYEPAFDLAYHHLTPIIRDSQKDVIDTYQHLQGNAASEYIPAEVGTDAPDSATLKASDANLQDRDANQISYAPGRLPDDLVAMQAIPSRSGPDADERGTDEGLHSATIPSGVTAESLQTMTLHVAISVMLLALFSRLHANKLANHPVRSRILDLIEDQPGIRLHEAAQRLNLGSGHVRYHVEMLVQHGVIHTVQRARARHLFPPGHRPEAKPLVVALSHPKTAQVFDTITRSPGARLKDIQAKLGMTPSLAHWHIQRLLREGVVRAERHGFNRYFPDA